MHPSFKLKYQFFIKLSLCFLVLFLSFNLNGHPQVTTDNGFCTGCEVSVHPDSTYYEPMIRVGRNVNIKAGRCEFPFLRYCARITPPGRAKYPGMPGYIEEDGAAQGNNSAFVHHGNVTGCADEDNIGRHGDNRKECNDGDISKAKPRTQLCAYEDPADHGENAFSGRSDNHHKEIKQDSFKVAEVFKYGVLALAEELDQYLNYIVARNLGCVDIPLAPFPPSWSNENWYGDNIAIKPTIIPDPDSDNTFFNIKAQLKFCYSTINKINSAGARENFEFSVSCDPSSLESFGEITRTQEETLEINNSNNYGDTNNECHPHKVLYERGGKQEDEPKRDYCLMVTKDNPQEACVYRINPDADVAGGGNDRTLLECFNRVQYMPNLELLGSTPVVGAVDFEVAFEGDPDNVKAILNGNPASYVSNIAQDTAGAFSGVTYLHQVPLSLERKCHTVSSTEDIYCYSFSNRTCVAGFVSATKHISFGAFNRDERTYPPIYTSSPNFNSGRNSLAPWEYVVPHSCLKKDTFGDCVELPTYGSKKTPITNACVQRISDDDNIANIWKGKCVHYAVCNSRDINGDGVVDDDDDTSKFKTYKEYLEAISNCPDTTFGGVTFNNVGMCCDDAVRLSPYRPIKLHPTVCQQPWRSTPFRNDKGECIEYVNNVDDPLPSVFPNERFHLNTRPYAEVFSSSVSHPFNVLRPLSQEEAEICDIEEPILSDWVFYQTASNDNYQLSAGQSGLINYTKSPIDLNSPDFGVASHTTETLSKKDVLVNIKTKLDSGNTIIKGSFAHNTTDYNITDGRFGIYDHSNGSYYSEHSYEFNNPKFVLGYNGDVANPHGYLMLDLGLRCKNYITNPEQQMNLELRPILYYVDKNDSFKKVLLTKLGTGGGKVKLYGHKVVTFDVRKCVETLKLTGINNFNYEIKYNRYGALDFKINYTDKVKNTDNERNFTLNFSANQSLVSTDGYFGIILEPLGGNTFSIGPTTVTQ